MVAKNTADGNKLTTFYDFRKSLFRTAKESKVTWNNEEMEFLLKDTKGLFFYSRSFKV